MLSVFGTQILRVSGNWTYQSGVKSYFRPGGTVEVVVSPEWREIKDHLR
jgi:hypothetical protein